MKIVVNGESVECGDAWTVEELIQRHSLSPATTLIEHNGTALHRREWSGRALQENDRVEILCVAAGG